jgi:hypothetical protein
LAYVNYFTSLYTGTKKPEQKQLENWVDLPGYVAFYIIFCRYVFVVPAHLAGNQINLLES